MDMYDPLKHGFFNRTKQDKECADKTKRLRQIRRTRSHPYGDLANRKARKELNKDLVQESASLVVLAQNSCKSWL